MAQGLISDILSSIVNESIEAAEGNNISDMEVIVDTSDENCQHDTSKEYIDLDVERKRFLRIIKKIKSDRHRACYQSILAHARRENPKLVMADNKLILSDLLVDNLIVNDSNNPLEESFRVLDTESTDTATIELKKPCVKQKKDLPKKNGSPKTAEKKHGDHLEQDTFDNLTSFIDNSFHSTLLNIIRREVKSCVASELENHKANELRVINTHTSSKNRDADTIRLLHDEIRMLKTELKLSKETATEKSDNELLLNNELFSEIDFLKKRD